MKIGLGTVDGHPELYEMFPPGTPFLLMEDGHVYVPGNAAPVESIPPEPITLRSFDGLTHIFEMKEELKLEGVVKQYFINKHYYEQLKKFLWAFEQFRVSNIRDYFNVEKRVANILAHELVRIGAARAYHTWYRRETLWPRKLAEAYSGPDAEKERPTGKVDEFMKQHIKEAVQEQKKKKGSSKPKEETVPTPEEMVTELSPGEDDDLRSMVGKEVFVDNTGEISTQFVGTPPKKKKVFKQKPSAPNSPRSTKPKKK